MPYGKPLELYEYIKENQQKKMLRCSDVQARRGDDHKDAVYFTSKGVFWSLSTERLASKVSSTKTSSKPVAPRLKANLAD